jgi:hypothetical protein
MPYTTYRHTRRIGRRTAWGSDSASTSSTLEQAGGRHTGHTCCSGLVAGLVTLIRCTSASAQSPTRRVSGAEKIAWQCAETEDSEDDQAWEEQWRE